MATRKRNPQDATTRKIRALKRKVAWLEARLDVLEKNAVSRVGGRKR